MKNDYEYLILGRPWGNNILRINDSQPILVNDDYVNNVWDKGHLAPAAAFNCDRETIKKTFSYLNCALQHEGLNRGPWKELERLIWEAEADDFIWEDEAGDF